MSDTDAPERIWISADNIGSYGGDWISDSPESDEDDVEYIRSDLRLPPELELWLLRLHNEPEQWTVQQAMTALTTIGESEHE
jgi:hypothetical protein